MILETLLSRLPWRRSSSVVSVVRLSGIIGQAGPLRQGLSLGAVAPLLERAFAPSRQTAVALVINSPGGSPTQSSLIAKRIRHLAAEKNVPVMAFVEDVAASGGYWLACAADEIFIDENSIVGSIGVVSAGFGFQDFIRRFGVERRIHTSGERKAMLDPFKPEREEDVVRLKAIQTDIHENFKAMVRERRGLRLKGAEADLFSGEFWTGRRAVELGLADAMGDLRGVLRDRFGDKVRLRVVSPETGWLRRRLGFSPSVGHAGPFDGPWAGEAMAALLTAVEERALWSRYGL